MKLTLLFPFCAALAVAAEPATVSDAIAQGKVSLNARLRYESAEQTSLKDSAALTLRTRLGFTTAALRGWQAMLEAENITAGDGDRYNQAGLNPGGAGRVVIADPETTEINQAWLAFAPGRTTAKLGRQRLALDNARFIGDVGWRQNQQTLDAFSVVDRTLDQTTFTYAYLWQVNRVLGDKHAQGDWRSDSHLFNASYAGYRAGTVTAYAYLLDFDNSAANSTATYGVSFAGSAPLRGDLKLTYRAEAAYQTDYGSNRGHYATDYLLAELGVAAKAGALTFGIEQLDNDGTTTFKAPLATAHAFNGWADAFPGPTNNGLRNLYAKVSANLPGGVSFLGFYHRFEQPRHVQYYYTALVPTFHFDHGRARELDLQLSRKFGPKVTGLVKYADFNRGSSSMPDIRKVWLQVEFAY